MTGHRAPATTEHYTHRKLERLRRAQELVEAFEREERIAAAAEAAKKKQQQHAQPPRRRT